MVFWLGVFAGALFVWIAVQIGFYATWTMFFNMGLSAYVAIFLTPVVISTVPAATETPYGYALVLVCVAIAALLISYGLTFACLSGDLRQVPEGIRQRRRGLPGLSDRILGLELCGIRLRPDAIVP